MVRLLGALLIPPRRPRHLSRERARSCRAELAVRDIDSILFDAAAISDTAAMLAASVSSDLRFLF